MKQESEIDTKAIMVKLSKLQADVDYVREPIEDVTLSDDDLKAIEDRRKDLKEGTTRRL